MKNILLFSTATLILLLEAFVSRADLVYHIDIDSQELGSNPTGPLATEAGFTSLDATASTTASVTTGGVVFQIFSADGSRVRASGSTPLPNALNGDFAFDDGPGEAVGLYLGGPGDLQAGTWEVDLYIWDQTSNPLTSIVGYRTGASIALKTETIIASNVVPVSNAPASTFRFVSDGVSAYDVFVRENDATNRARLNAVSLRFIPEPSTFALSLLGLVLLRRKLQG